MTAIRSQYAREFERLMRERRVLLLESMTIGHDHPAYMRLVGEVQGMDAAMKLSEQADYNLNGDEPDARA